MQEEKTVAIHPQMPRQIPYIIASEGCERFSFYGMRNILTVFLMTSLLLAIPEHLRKDRLNDNENSRRKTLGGG